MSKTDVLYYWKFNGVNHDVARDRILSKPSFPTQFEELIRYYPILGSGPHYFTYDSEGKTKEKIYCACSTCQQDPGNTLKNFTFLELISKERFRLKAILSETPDFATKAAAWVTAGLWPFGGYGESPEDAIRLIPTNPEEITDYNHFVYQYLLQTDIGFVLSKGLGAMVADFETRMARALYPDQLLRDTKAQIIGKYNDHKNKVIQSTFRDLIAGGLMNWGTASWEYIYATGQVEAHEVYLFLRYLEDYPGDQIKDGFVQYAAAVFGADDAGLSWKDISEFFEAAALEYKINVPHVTQMFPDDGSLLCKRKGFEENLLVFTADARYTLLVRLATNFSHVPGARELTIRLQALFGPMSKLFRGVSRDLLSEVLGGLADYPKAEKLLQQGIQMIHDGKDYRGALDNMRLSLELFLRQYLGNSKSLENQQEALGGFLKGRDVAAPIRAMIWPVIDCYTKYNNDRVKHENKVELADVNTMLYMTATLIHRMLMSLI